jgi:hypothetical protein
MRPSSFLWPEVARLCGAIAGGCLALAVCALAADEFAVCAAFAGIGAAAAIGRSVAQKESAR